MSRLLIRWSWLITACFLLLILSPQLEAAEPGKGLKSCGPGKMCVPRTLCNEGLLKDPGFELLVPRISNTDSGCAGLQRCCSVDQVCTPNNILLIDTLITF